MYFSASLPKNGRSTPQRLTVRAQLTRSAPEVRHTSPYSLPPRREENSFQMRRSPRAHALADRLARPLGFAGRGESGEGGWGGAGAAAPPPTRAGPSGPRRTAPLSHPLPISLPVDRPACPFQGSPPTRVPWACPPSPAFCRAGQRCRTVQVKAAGPSSPNCKPFLPSGPNWHPKSSPTGSTSWRRWRRLGGRACRRSGGSRGAAGEGLRQGLASAQLRWKSPRRRRDRPLKRRSAWRRAAEQSGRGRSEGGPTDGGGGAMAHRCQQFIRQ